MKNKFNLRNLEIRDASLMLEWMHDDNVIKKLKNNFKEKNIEDCKSFIKKSICDKKNCNLAIVDDTDTYLGTVSIKNIDRECNSGEFAITIRSSAMGSGCSTYAIKEIISYGFTTLGLKYIYWYVDKDNMRAIKFYDKNKFSKIEYYELIKLINVIDDLNNENYIWYLVDNK